MNKKRFLVFLCLLAAVFFSMIQLVDSDLSDESLLGEWRNDAEQETISFEPKGVVKWTFTFKGFGDTSASTGTYKVHDNKVEIERCARTPTVTLAISAGKLTLNRGGKVLTYLRGYPLNRTNYPECKLIVLTCDMKTSPVSIESAIKKLNPVEIGVYDPKGNERTITAVVENAIATRSLAQAKADKAFIAAKVSDGTERDESYGKILTIGPARDELMFYGAKPHPSLIQEAMKKFGGELQGQSLDIMRFPNGNIISTLLSLSADKRYSSIGPYYAAQGQNVFIVNVNTQTPAEQLESSILKLKPDYLYFADAKSGKQAIGIKTIGPDSLAKSIALARSDKSFISVEIPSTEKQRIWLWDHNLNPIDNFRPPYNQLMLYGAKGISEANVHDSIRKLGGTFQNDSGMYLLQCDRKHVICTFIKALNDPNLTGVSQNLALGG